MRNYLLQSLQCLLLLWRIGNQRLLYFQSWGLLQSRFSGVERVDIPSNIQTIDLFGYTSKFFFTGSLLYWLLSTSSWLGWYLKFGKRFLTSAWAQSHFILILPSVSCSKFRSSLFLWKDFTIEGRLTLTLESSCLWLLRTGSVGEGQRSWFKLFRDSTFSFWNLKQ